MMLNRHRSEGPRLDPVVALRRRYESLRRKAVDAFAEARYQESSDLFAQVLQIACRLEDPTLTDRAFCGQTAAALAVGAGEPQAGPLRDRLNQSGDEETCFLASYILASQVFSPQGEHRKSLFYSQVARTHAERLGRADWLASCHNETANALVGISLFDEACREYEEALDLVPEDDLFKRAVILDNLGYCRLVQKRHEEGFRMLFWSLRTLRRLGLPQCRATHIGLSSGYLDIGRYRPALRHGLEALRIAEELGDTRVTKQALYLLGEAAKLAGATDTAYRFYRRLQEEFYPGGNPLAELLLTVDTRSLVNLGA